LLVISDNHGPGSPTVDKDNGMTVPHKPPQQTAVGGDPGDNDNAPTDA
jgi:hypothetical protein